MGEERQAAALIALVFLVGLIGLFLTGGLPGMGGSFASDISLGDVYVDSYRADIYLNGTLAEQFVYDISASGKYKMLYRSWKMPLSQRRLNSPYVALLNISPPQGTVPYLKDLAGNVTVLSAKDNGYGERIFDLAENSEAGCLQPQMFSAGRYRIDYRFLIHPFLERDREFCHWNLRLADTHLPYRQAAIHIHDPEGLLVSLFPHPEMEYSRQGDAWVVTGSSPRDEVIEMEMLLRPEASSHIDGFLRQVPDVRGKTLSAQDSGFSPLPIIQTLVLIFPLILGVVYLRYGRERHYAVPGTLSRVPCKRKPWLVNLVFKGDAFDFDKNGFYATLLDLHRRGVLEIDSVTGTRIRMLKPLESGEDEYEGNVLNFLRANSIAGVFNAGAFEDSIKNLQKSHDTSRLQELHRAMDGLLRYKNRDAAGEFVAGRSLRCLGLDLQPKNLIVILYLAVFFFAFSGGFHILANPLTAALLILLAQFTLVAFAPSALLGRWKQEYYREKMEWDAFRNLLSDFAMIRKYAPEDLVLWKEWLVYGTALGVGDKVMQAMADLNIRIPEAVAVQSVQTHFSHAYSSSSPKSSGSGSGGGGFGGAVVAAEPGEPSHSTGECLPAGWICWMI
ncbi:MAG: DUF2207 domain-containing protein [Methanothrix sp.]|nr:DUF2207 domain-containing protein [Methanothrix sp.]